jgi:DUF4097 and DUF4098 domain-containing protein YvlB
VRPAITDLQDFASVVPLTDAEALRRVNIYTVSINVVIIPDTSLTAPRVVVHGDIEPRITHTNGILNVDTRQQERGMRYPSLQWNFTSAGRREIRLYVPMARLDHIIVNSTSGNIRIEGVDSQEITARSVSGSIRMHDSTVGEGNLNSTSGSVELTNTQVRDGILNSVSGRIVIDGGRIYDLAAVNVSGNINIDTGINHGGSANISSTSGTVRFTGERTSQRQNVGYTLSTLSGSMRVNGERIHGRSSGNAMTHVGYTITIRTTSGNIHLDYD